MTIEEEGVYIRLLSYCWREGSIPSDLTLLSRLCKGAKVSRMANVITAFDPMPGDPSRLIHGRLEGERKKQETYRDKQKEKGARGASKRWQGDSHGHSTGDGTGHTPAIAETGSELKPHDGSSSSTSSSSSASVLETHTARTSPSIADVRLCAERFQPTSTVPKKPDAGFVDWWFDEQEKCGWVDPKTGHPWHNWQAAFTAAWRAAIHNRTERDSRRGSRPPASGAPPIHTPGDDKL